MPSNCKYFNRQLLSSDKRISGSYELRDAIEFVGRYHCRTKPHGREGVLISGQTKTHGITLHDYLDVHKPNEQRPIANWSDSKRLHIIVNSLPFHLCFLIFHIDSRGWKKFFSQYLNLGEQNTIVFDKADGRRRSPPLVRFVEECVTKLTRQDQKTLSRLNDTLEDDDKIRFVYLLLKHHAWNDVLDQHFITEKLPEILELTNNQFIAKHVVDVSYIIKLSTYMYGQFLEELEQDRGLFMDRANQVVQRIDTVESDENSNDDDGDEDSTVLSTSSSTSNGTGKRKREDDSDDDNHDDNNDAGGGGDFDNDSSMNNNMFDDNETESVEEISNQEETENLAREAAAERERNRDAAWDHADGAGFDDDSSMDDNETELVEEISNQEEAEILARRRDDEDSLEYVNYDETEDEARDNEAALVAILGHDEDDDKARERDQEVVSGEARDQDHRGVLVEMNRIEAEDEARVNLQKLVAARNTIENLQHQFRAERTRSAAERVRFANQLAAERVHSANQLAAERVRSTNLERQLAYAQSLLHGSERNINNPADVMDTSDTNGIGTSNSFNIHINNSNSNNRNSNCNYDRDRNSNDNNNINIKINVPPTNRN